MKMLIVDDSRTMRNFLAAIAQELSFETTLACDGVDALPRLTAPNRFEVALVDWEMPRMDGISLLKAVRERRDLDHMKILMVTSLSTMSSVTEALQKGADDYLMKPVTSEMVAEKLRLLGILD